MNKYTESIPLGLITIDQAAAKTKVEKLRNGIAVFTNGVFDILHRGHLDYLAAARDLGHKLFVGLNSDSSVHRIKGDDRPINNERDRALALLSLKCVDYVILFDEDTPERLIRAITPDILVKGGDYKVEEIVGYDHVVASGGKVVTIPLSEGYSTTGFIEKIVKTYSR
ncbi:D-glycero-beta-D-manno-heptose 1-phosphate adenylyltransferase [bacterium]|nr:D-glycero-beta-D-manno-heptose 1-phosphate adenylyltransferase [bacterium]